MGAATVTQTSYGYKVTGDTGAILISAYRVWVKRILFVPNSAGNQFWFLNKDGVELLRIFGLVKQFPYCLDVGGDSGAPFDSLQLGGMSNGSDILYIFIR